MPMIVIAFVLAWMIMGAVEQARQDAGSVTRAAFQRARVASQDRIARIQHSDSPWMRSLARATTKTGAVLGALGRAGWRVATGTARSLSTGAQWGREEGLRRGKRFVARRRVEARRRKRVKTTRQARPGGVSTTTEPAPEPEPTPPPPTGPTSPSAAEPEVVDAEIVEEPNAASNKRDTAPPVVDGEVIAEPRSSNGAVTNVLAGRIEVRINQPSPDLNREPTSGGAIVTAPIRQITGEAPGISQARDNLRVVGAAATIYLDMSEQVSATARNALSDANQLVAAIERLQTSYASAGIANGPDGADVAVLSENVAAMRAATQTLIEASQRLAAATEAAKASADAALAGLNTRHGAAEEAIKATPVPATTAFLRN